MARIVLDDVTKVFGRDVVAVDHVSLQIHEGECMVLVGPSGCGKSTILRLVAGLEQVTAGEIWIGDKLATDLLPRDRDVAMVFQNYAIYPHMTVADNIGFGLRIRGVAREERRRKVEEVAGILGLGDLLDRKPAALSGGQRQRVAMGRAMIRQPQALLLDEPLSNLDAKLRVQMRAELARIHEQVGATMVYVTHDQVEAMTLGDRVAVLRDGVVQQVAEPHELFNQPTNLFVAAFIGSPPMNLVEAVVDDGHVRFGGLGLPVPHTVDLPAAPGRRVILGIRPSDFHEPAVAPGLPVMEVPVELVEDLGSELHVMFRVDASPVITSDTRAAAEDEASVEPVALGGSEGTTMFTARVDARMAVRAGTRTALAVDPNRLYFFDPVTGDAAGTPSATAAAR
jgi:multiple sugar transport system ATP-binding protein